MMHLCKLPSVVQGIDLAARRFDHMLSTKDSQEPLLILNQLLVYMFMFVVIIDIKSARYMSYVA